jgi:hypothetical protein
MLKLPSLRDVAADVGNPIIVQLFSTQSADDWGHDVHGLVIGHAQNILIASVFVKLQNGLLYCHCPFCCPTSI